MAESGRAFFERLKRHLHAHPSQSIEAPGARLKEAAVLAPLFWKDEEPFAYLTVRPLTLRKHPGQISFPGGRREASDLTPLHAALRETHEELGISPAAVQVLGTLGSMPTVTSYWVTPFVGVVSADVAIAPSADEIAQVIVAPLWRLRREQRFLGAALRDVWVWDEAQHVVWGATGHMLGQLLTHIEAIT
jgi:8-oxo-dGTP pyrophosphatase MutT (NUDIX family)